MDKIIYGKVTKGIFKPRDPTAFKLCFAKLEGKEVEVVVRKKKKHRSGAQNAYLWAVPYELISDDLGYTPQEVHDAMRFQFLTDASKELPKMRSTSDLTTVEFEEYVSKVRQWAAEFRDIYIPEPNEVDYE